MDATELISLYTGAWCEPDRARRQQLLERCWAEDGTYADPTAQVSGRAALVEHIGAFFGQFPGARLESTSGVDAHHDQLRFNWRMLLADGKVFVEGVDFGERSGDGKLQRVVGFFGPLEPKP